MSLLSRYTRKLMKFFLHSKLAHVGDIMMRIIYRETIHIILNYNKATLFWLLLQRKHFPPPLHSFGRCEFDSALLGGLSA